MAAKYHVRPNLAVKRTHTGGLLLCVSQPRARRCAPLTFCVRLLMPYIRRAALLGAFGFALCSSILPALAANFTGTWYIDLRTNEQRQQKFECGRAFFKLLQVGDRVIGEHSFATASCGRMNEGGDGTVKGVVVGATAVLAVTSGRNGAIVLGKATRRGSKLHWVTLEELSAGEPEGDSPLILGKGVLSKEK